MPNEPEPVRSPDLDDLASALAADAARVVQALAVTIVVAEDRIAQQALAPTGERFVLAVPGGCIVEAGGGTPFRLLRKTRNAMALDLYAMVGADAALGGLIADRVGRSGALKRAEKLLQPWLSTARLPDRREAAELGAYSIAIEPLAYQVAARASLLVDEQAPARRKALSDAADIRRVARGHWSLVALQARMTLLASASGASEWLVDMSRSLRWTSWTPTFPLVRERSLWAAMIGARSAAAFGASVIDSYLEVLSRVDQPYRVFDAVLGLVALACSDRAAEGTVERQLAKLENVFAHPSSARAIASALRVIRDPDGATARASSMFGWSLDGLAGVATRPTLVADAGDFGPEGDFIGLMAVPAALAAEAEQFFPAGHAVRSGPALWLPDRDLAALLSLQHSEAGNTSGTPLH